MKHEDRRKYFHWDKSSLLKEVLNLHEKLVNINSISSESCEFCQNLKNRPKNEGCGLDVCLDQISNILK